MAPDRYRGYSWFCPNRLLSTCRTTRRTLKFSYFYLVSGLKSPRYHIINPTIPTPKNVVKHIPQKWLWDIHIYSVKFIIFLPCLFTSRIMLDVLSRSGASRTSNNLWHLHRTCLSAIIDTTISFALWTFSWPSFINIGQKLIHIDGFLHPTTYQCYSIYENISWPGV